MPPTLPQINYLTTLLIDCGFVDREQRNGYLTKRVGRQIKYIDELHLSEASLCINLLKDMKTQLKISRRALDGQSKLFEED